MPGEFFQRSIWRVGRPDAVKSFINVRSAGHYITIRDFRDRGGRKDFLQLLWCRNGEGFVESNGKKIKLSSGEIFFHLPGSIHTIYSEKPGWDYYWFTCDGPDMDAVIKAFGIKEEKRYAGECPVLLFSTLIESLLKIDINEALRASVTAYEILIRANNPPLNSSANHQLPEKFQNLVTENFADPDFSLQQAANEMHVHRSTLHRVFTANNGISPQEYLTVYRLQQALKLLYSEMTIKEIAEECGFNTQHYFAKVFRRYFGLSPAEFRLGITLDNVNIDVTHIPKVKQEGSK